MKTIKQWAALALCLALLCTLLPQLSLTAHAEGETSGSCGAEGSDLTWEINTATGVLTISGSGAMEDYEEWSIPWRDYVETITAVALPEGLTHVGNNAFSGCAGVTAVTLPSGLNSIGQSAFRGCSLTAVSFPAALTAIGDNAFSDCTKLTSAAIPNGFTTVSWGMFSGCTALTSASLPTGLQYIEGAAFAGCTSLAGISIPTSVRSIGDYAFSGCTALTGIDLPAGLTAVGASCFADCTGLASVTIPNNMHYINSAAFSGCTGLTSVTLPDGLRGIDKEAFRDCTALSAISFPAGLEIIDRHAFAGCAALTSVSIPASVTTLGLGAFSGCAGLTGVVLSAGLMTVPERAFENCSSLTSLAIPSGVRRINKSAFAGCTSLTSVSLPESLIGIEALAFLDCPALTEVTIPESVILVGGMSFGFVSTSDAEATKVGSFTIYGYKDSAAERYATENGFNFVSLTPQKNPFVDVSESDFFFDPVMWALENDVTGGTDETHFSPNNTVMRADAMVFFWAAKGRPQYTGSPKSFKDVKKSHWAYDAVMWAVQNKITGGTDAEGTYFSPQRTCTRSEILQFLYAAMDKPSYTIANPYSDVKDKHWYRDGAIWAYEQGLEKGENGKFGAKTPCTRGYVVTYLYRFITGQELAE